jgi:mRNA interferase MazF
VVNPKRGALYWVRFDPAIGSEAAQTRPALVVSSDANNKAMPTLSVVPLTSSVKRLYPFEVFLEASESKLPKDAKIQTQQIRTVSHERLEDLIGEVSVQTMILVGEALKLHLQLT